MRNLCLALTRSCGSKISLARFGSSSVKRTDDAAQKGWLSKLMTGPPVGPDGQVTAAHSTLLSEKEYVYELAMHLWKHADGYVTTDRLMDVQNTDKEVAEALGEQGRLCKKRMNCLLLSFSYWGEPKPRPPKHVYELRSYMLKPGTMIEWGNHWARGINYRRDFNQDVGGFFSQVGRLYMVFHLWAYEDFGSRKTIREKTWEKPGWDQTVSYTGSRRFQRLRSEMFSLVCEYVRRQGELVDGRLLGDLVKKFIIGSGTPLQNQDFGYGLFLMYR